MSALRIGPLAAAAVSALVVAVVAFAAPGDVDPTFGVNGRVALSPFVESYATSIAVQPDGKLVLAGTADDVAPPPPPPPSPGRPFFSDPDFLAVRLTPNGGVDSGFGSNGVVRTPIGTGGPVSDGARTVAVGPDGSIVLAGFTVVPGGTDLAFARYTSSGALDSSFSGDGIQTVDIGSIDGVNGVLVEGDGAIVAVGTGGSGLTLVRLRRNGQLDPSFGNGGIVNTPVGDPGLQDEAAAVVERSGAITVAGTADVSFDFPDFVVARYFTRNGRLDPGFGSGGIAVTRRSGHGRALAIVLAPGGGIVVGGLGDGGYRVARFLRDGTLDRTFGGSGVVGTGFRGLFAAALGVGVQADGKIVAAGTGSSSAGSGFTAARYNVDGTLDSSFGAGGKSVYTLPEIRNWGAGSALQASSDPGAAGRLVIAGQYSEAGADHMAAVGVDLGPLAPSQRIVRCRVPRVIALRLATARKKLRRANCSVGRVSRARSRRARGRVIRQRPRPGAVRARGARVSLVVSRGRR